MVKPLEIDDVRCERWIALGSQGDDGACRDLVEYLWPRWVEMLGASRQMQALANVEDGIHDVALRLVVKLGRPEGPGLRLYPPWKERNPDKTFSDWLRIVTRNATRDYVREVKGTPRGDGSETSVKRLLNEFASSPLLDDLGIRPPFTWAQTARELLDFATQRLTSEQLVILEAWLQGTSFEELAPTLGTSAQAAKQSLRAAIAVLRRHFAGKRATASSPED